MILLAGFLRISQRNFFLRKRRKVIRENLMNDLMEDDVIFGFMMRGLAMARKIRTGYSSGFLNFIMKLGRKRKNLKQE